MMSCNLQKQEFFSFEGIDGSGKTTIIQEIKRELNNQKIQTQLMPEFPEGIASKGIENALGKSLYVSEYFEEGLVPSFFYLLYARSLCIEKILSQNGIILMDRYIESMVLYQGYFLFRDKDKFQPIKLINCMYDLFELLNLPIPDKTFIFLGPLDEVVKRLEERENRFLSKFEKDTLPKFIDYYENILESSVGNYIRIDLTKPINYNVDYILKILLEGN